MTDDTEQETTGETPATPTEAPTTAIATREKLRATAPLRRTSTGGVVVMPRDMQEAMEFAKLMSKAEGMVGLHLLGNPGACLAVTLQAMEWGMSPFAVAAKTYTATKPKPDEPLGQIAYEAQLINAVVNARAPIDGRLQHDYQGEGDEMVCRVWGTFKGADKPSMLDSEPLKRLMPGKNDYGKLKGSSLWLTKPRQQIYYNTVRDWARMFCPEIILGAYTVDELQDYADEPPKAAVDPFAGEGPKQLPAAGISSPLADTSGAAPAEAAPVSSSEGAQ